MIFVSNLIARSKSGRKSIGRTYSICRMYWSASGSTSTHKSNSGSRFYYRCGKIYLSFSGNIRR